MPAVLLVALVLLLVPSLVSTERLSHHSHFSVYRHAAVASDAAPCSEVGMYVSTNNAGNSIGLAFFTGLTVVVNTERCCDT